LSPQTRRGRAVPASRRTRGRPDAEPHPATTDESVAGDQPLESHLSSEGKRAKIAPARRKKHHGTAYRWFSAYLPLLLVFFVLLGGVWAYTSFINPPPLTPAQQWTKIENKWSPAREEARQSLSSHDLDFVAQQKDFKDFYTQTKGWVDDVTAVSDWGLAQNEVASFLSDSQNYLSLLQQAYTSTTPEQVATLSDSLPSADQTWDTEVALIRTDLGMPAVAATPSPLVLPSVNATPSGSGAASPATSGSPAATGSTTAPGASPSVAPSASQTAAPSPTPKPS
jgi:hypothetical protein